ncbi:MAG: YncE family protein [Planctomycetota bacterium]
MAPLALLLAAVPTCAGGGLPELSLDEPFPVVGSQVMLTLTGPPGALFSVQGAALPTELSLGALGTLYLDPGLLITAAAGALDASGQASIPVPVPPNPELDDALFHLQAGTLAGGEIQLSNSVTMRFGLAAPSGVRNPESVAITPDGAKAFVAHQEDGSVSIVDVAAGALRRDLPVGPRPVGKGFEVSVEVDPEGRHAFVVNPWTAEVAVIEVASESLVARLPVPRASRDVAFDFSGAAGVVYVTNERDDAVLRFLEAAPGVFVPLAPLALEGADPGVLAVHADGRLVVGHRTSHELEVVDPSQPAGATTVARYPLNRLPYDVEVDGDRVLVATFDVFVPGDGQNELLALDVDTGAILGSHLIDRGTDYLDVERLGSRVAVVGAGSGSVVLADGATLAFDSVVDLAPFQPLATPQDAVFVPGAGAEPSALLVTNYFRDSLAVIDLAGPGPFAVATEIPLHGSGALQVPLFNLTQEDDGDWWFRSVQFFNGTPQNPNPVTCATCHPYGAGSDGLTHPGRQAMPMFDLGNTAPYGSGGFQPSLLGTITSTFFAHGQIGGGIPFQADLDILAFLTNDAPPPPSPHFLPDGSLSSDALAGKALFEGAAGCAACHAPPLFLPPPPSPKTIPGGVGTGLAPANVPSLRGAWATAPYLHDHTAETFLDVLTNNPGDQHGATSGLTAAERDQLVEYLKTL